ncbi:MAG: MFS transporter [Chloroflexi bacterium]|nr:MAG: MFS transporter [Chloroflexota bacterium]
MDSCCQSSVTITTMPKMKLSPMMRRMLPLYIAVALQNIPFWYAIEKLFMLGIGFNTATIGVMVAIMSIAMIVVETPSGILADRWSRKGVMALGCVALLISTIIGAVSMNEPVYVIAMVFWGVYAAFYSGTYDSVIYDTTMEEHGNSRRFEKYLGGFRAVEGGAAVVGALAGGLIASFVDIRDAYIFTAPLLALALIFILKFREPQLHKAEVAEPVFKHIRQTFAAVLKNRVLLPVIIAAVGFFVIQDIIFEFNQLWFIAVAAPIALYGVLSAVVFSSWTVGGLLASHIKSKAAIITLMSVTVAAIAVLIISRHYIPILATQFVMAVCLIAISVILAKKMHDQLPSRLRAGSLSVTSTLARILLIPGSLLLTGIANIYDIFTATWILLTAAAVSIVAFMSISSVKK